MRIMQRSPATLAKHGVCRKGRYGSCALILPFITVTLAALSLSCSSRQQEAAGTLQNSNAHLSTDTETARIQKLTSRYLGKTWKVIRVSRERAGGGGKEYEISLNIHDGDTDSIILSFQDTHTDYEKFAQVRAGQEITFEYSNIDGDPKTTFGGSTLVVPKYLRLGKVR